MILHHGGKGKMTYTKNYTPADEGIKASRKDANIFRSRLGRYETRNRNGDKRMSKDTKTVSVRLTTEEIALLDDLGRHFGGRSKAIKIMIRFYYSMLHPQFWKTTKLKKPEGIQ